MGVTQEQSGESRQTSRKRIEHEAFGAIEVPAGRYWGAQTQRALGVFEVGEERFPARLIRTFGHVNCSQSSNDSFPTVMHIAVVLDLRERLLPALTFLQESLSAKAAEFGRS
jgi:fumarate hydratase class II